MEIKRPVDLDGSVECEIYEDIHPFCHIVATMKTAGIWKVRDHMVADVWREMVDQLDARHPHGNILVSRNVSINECWSKSTAKIQGLFLLGAQEKESKMAKAIDPKFSAKNGAQYAILEQMTLTYNLWKFIGHENAMTVPGVGIYKFEVTKNYPPSHPAPRWFHLVFYSWQGNRKDVLYHKKITEPFEPESKWEKVSRHAPLEHLLRFYAQLTRGKE